MGDRVGETGRSGLVIVILLTIFINGSGMHGCTLCDTTTIVPICPPARFNIKIGVGGISGYAWRRSADKV